MIEQEGISIAPQWDLEGTSLLEELKARYPFAEFAINQGQQYEFINTEIPVNRLYSTISELQAYYNFIFLLDIAGRDLRYIKESHNDFEITYLLLNLENHIRMNLKVSFRENDSIPSISDIWNNAYLLESEVATSFGIQVAAPVRYQPLCSWEDQKFFPLRKDHDFERMPEGPRPSALYFENIYGLNYEERVGKTWYDIGPLHPATGGGYRIMMELEGERICRSKIELGYNFRGVEKKCENVPYRFLPDIAEDMSSSLGISHGLTAVHCLEEILKACVPERAQALRMVLLEMERVHEHCLSLSRICQTIQVVSGWENFLHCREIIEDILSKLNLNPYSIRSHRLGGVSFDVDRRWIFETLGALRELEQSVESWHSTLTRNRLWMERTEVGELSAADAIYAGLGGPLLRSCGVNYDLRKISPYYFYSEIEFEVPLGINGRVYDRYLVMISEIKQSVLIIQQLLENLPQGKVLNPDFSEHHFKTDWNIPFGSYYSSLEGPRGEFGISIHSSEASRPDRIKFRSPSLATSSIISDIISEESLDNALVILSSLPVNMGELDR